MPDRVQGGAPGALCHWQKDVILEAPKCLAVVILKELWTSIHSALVPSSVG